MIKWCKTLFRIVSNYDRDLQKLQAKANRAHITAEEAVKIIRDRTTINVDASPSMRDPSIVVMIGRYRNQDYVQIHSIQAGCFADLVEHLREMKRYGTVAKMDAPMHFRDVFVPEVLKF